MDYIIYVFFFPLIHYHLHISGYYTAFWTWHSFWDGRYSDNSLSHTDLLFMHLKDLYARYVVSFCLRRVFYFYFLFFCFFTNWQMLPDEGWIAGGDLVDVSM